MTRSSDDSQMNHRSSKAVTTGGRRDRKNARVDITSWAELVEVGKEANAFSVTVQDISRGGLGAYSLASMPVGTHVEIRLKFVSGDQRFVTEKLWGRIVSSKHFGSSYTLGVEFVAPVADATCPKLSEYLRSLEKA